MPPFQFTEWCSRYLDELKVLFDLIFVVVNEKLLF
jgi:hypothetical protein